MSERKEITIKESSGKEVKLFVKKPNYDEVDEADKVYATKVASLVRQNGNKKLLLRSEIDKYLRETGVWTTEDEKKVAEVNKQIEDLLTKLRKGGLKLSEGRKLCLDIFDKRNEIVRIMSKRRIFDDTTIEAMAESDRVDYLVYVCTVYEDGSNYWDSFEDMKNDKISQAYQKGYVAVMDIVFGINAEFEKKLPENRWLKKYGFIDEDLNFLDRKTGKRVDKNGNPIEELEQSVNNQLDNIQGEIKEEQPFIDDDTNEPVNP